MKTIDKTISLLCLLTIHSTANAQLVSENFNAGLPATWTQSPAATWSLTANPNAPGNCIVNENAGSNSVTATFISPTLNLTGLQNFTFTFKGAVTKNNFVAPEIILSYSSTAGIQNLATWGSAFNPNATYTIAEGFETQTNLSPANVYWQNCTHTVSSVNGTTGRFLFTANNINGGWTLLDDIVISGVATTTLATSVIETQDQSLMSIFPNPSAKGVLKLAGKNIKEVLVEDALGRRLPIVPISAGDTFVELDLQNISKGVYYLTAILQNNRLIRKKILLE